MTLRAGDRILLQKRDAPRGHWYEGAVHVVRRDEVGLRFNTSFGGWSDKQQYNVHFKLNRYPLRRQHQALSVPVSPERLLFPNKSHLRGPNNGAPNVRLRFFNTLLEKNLPQVQAVTSVVRLKPGAVPFAVFGP
jgi:helicase MOV-10